MRLSLSRAVIAVAAVGLVAGGCDGTAAVSTADPATTTTQTTIVARSVAEDAFLAEQAARVSIPASAGAFMVAVVDADGEVAYAAAGTDPDGNPPMPDAAFRFASLTKVFTSLAILSLVDEGLVDLDAPAGDYLTRVAVPEGVTVRDLLQHTSGIPDYVDEPDFQEAVFADPHRVWQPEEMVEFVAGLAPHFPPGSEWHWRYSSTNYAMLGMLIEEVAGRSFSDVLRDRIIEPLGLDGTYLAGFEDGPVPFVAFAPPSPRTPPEPIDFDYTSLATSAWAAGGIVSTVPDIHLLFTAVFDGRVISFESLEEMIGSPRTSVISQKGNQSGYGLGIQVWTRFGGREVEGLVGHGGSITGYETLTAHAPDTGMTAVWVATSNWIDSSPSYSAVEQLVACTD